MKYCDPKFITATCFESEKESYKKYNEETVKQNIENIKKLNCTKILFGIDACSLEKTFLSNKYQRIIFMFPHVSGRSNIRKNRELMRNFLLSARSVLKKSENFDIYENNTAFDQISSCIYITLAKGQGGTNFEVDLNKRCNKDSWNINEIAQNCGYILTDCYLLNSKEFDCYRSTGFRNQSKSFHIESGLVHKFELSLKLVDLNNDKQLFFNLVHDYIRKSNFFIQNEFEWNNGTNKIIHPFVQLKYMLVNYLNKDLNKNLNFIHEKLYNEGISIYEIMTKIEDSLNNSQFKIDESCINILSGLVLKQNALNFDFEIFKIYELNNFRYEILIYIFDKKIKFDTIKSKLICFFQDLFKNGKILEITDSDISIDSKQLVHFKVINSSEFSFIINADIILILLFELKDERLLYSNDKRIFLKNDAFIVDTKFNWIIKPISIENSKWYHDISFWLNENKSFKYFDFINIIRDTCSDLAKNVQLIDIYIKNDEKTGKVYKSYCFRILYESFDRALSWNDTTNIQLNLRKKLTLYMNIKLK